MDTRLCDLRSALRRTTRCAHERTDDAYSGVNLGTRDGRITFLTAHHLAFQEVEQQLAVAPDLPAFPARTGLIAADLIALGSLPPKQQQLGPRLRINPLGFAYVVGGSHFGARHLLSQWNGEDGGEHEGTSRYLSDGALGTYWRALRPHLAAPFAMRDDSAIVDSAVFCFYLFDRALELVKTARAS